MGLGCVPRNRPLPSRNSTIVFRTWTAGRLLPQPIGSWVSDPCQHLASETEAGCYPIRNKAVPDLVAGPAGVRPASLVERAVIIEDVDELQVVALAGGEILGVVRWRDLQTAGARMDQLCIGSMRRRRHLYLYRWSKLTR